MTLTFYIFTVVILLLVANDVRIIILHPGEHADYRKRDILFLLVIAGLCLWLAASGVME